VVNGWRLPKRLLVSGLQELEQKQDHEHLDSSRGFPVVVKRSSVSPQDVGLDGTTRYRAARSSSSKGDFQKVSRQNKGVCMHARLSWTEEGNGSQAFRNIVHHQASRKCKV
jgi:hypothetical protein